MDDSEEIPSTTHGYATTTGEVGLHDTAAAPSSFGSDLSNSAPDQTGKSVYDEETRLTPVQHHLARRRAAKARSDISKFQ